MTYKIAFIGAQTGDEGKGVREVYYVKKAVDLATKLSGEREELYAWTMRWQGGANAGHTLEINGQRYALHQVPSAIVIPGTYNLMGEGVFIEPKSCLNEINELRKRGIDINIANLGIASNAHVTLSYHLEDDTTASVRRVGHTSTGRGIGPTAVDKYGRVGIRFQEFINRLAFIESLEQRFPTSPPHKIRDIANQYSREREELGEFSALQENVLNNLRFKFGIGEGAQGFQLDVDRGLYPGVSSSSPSIVSFRADKIVGVVKMYESSIGGNRPFVGRISDVNLENRLRTLWGEHGTTTGKPRNLGWLDAVALKHAIMSAEIDCLVSTCGDRIGDLSKMGGNVKVVVGYKIDGNVFCNWDRSFHDRRTLYRAQPIFEEFEPWETFFDKDKGKLSPNAQRFVDRVQELVGVEFVSHGYGPDIKDVFEVKDILIE